MQEATKLLASLNVAILPTSMHFIYNYKLLIAPKPFWIY